MSIRVMSSIWDLDLPDSEKLIALALADWCNDEGVCWPSVAQLAKKASKSVRTVQAVLGSLESKKVLTRDMKPGKGTTYTLTPCNICTPAAAAPPQRTTRTPAAAADNTLGTIITQKASPSSARANKSRFVVPPDIPADAWADFEEMRRVIRKPMTAKGRALAVTRLRKLAEAGWPPGEVLNHSTLNNYQGLFPPKDDGNGNRTGTDRMAGNDGLGLTSRAARDFLADHGELHQPYAGH